MSVALKRRLPAAEQERVHDEVVVVDQAGVREGLVQRGAAVEDDRAAFGLLERGDLLERAQDREMNAVLVRVRI